VGQKKGRMKIKAACPLNSSLSWERSRVPLISAFEQLAGGKTQAAKP